MGQNHAGHGTGEGAGSARSHAPDDFGAAFAIGTALNVAIVILEAWFGLLANSMALLADAGHNLGDVLGLVLAWGAAVLARRQPSARYTYGFRRGTILAALLNATVLLVAIGAIAVEAIRRLIAPEPMQSGIVMAVAAVGIVLNTLTAWLFAAGRKHDLNLGAAFLHMAADALTSGGVLVAAGAIALTGWNRLDPAVSLAIAGVILLGAWRLMREAAGLALDAVPAAIRPEEVRAFLEGSPGVSSVHDLHIWAMSTTETALTAHLLMPGRHPGDAFLTEVARELHTAFGIGHATLQIEVEAHVACPLEPDEVV